MCGARYNALSYLAASPTSTTDFAMLTRSHFISTPFTHKNTFGSNFCQDQGNWTHSVLVWLNSTGFNRDELTVVCFFTKQRTTVMVETPKLLSGGKTRNSGNSLVVALLSTGAESDERRCPSSLSAPS